MILLKVGDIVLTRAKKSLLADAIVWVMKNFQKDPVRYSHVAMAVDESSCIEAQWKTKVSDLEDILKNTRHYKIIRDENLDFNTRKRIANKALSKVGNTYGVFRLILQLFDHVFYTNWFTGRIAEDDYQVCSSLIAWAYQKETGNKINNVHWPAVEPDDFDDESENMNWTIVAEK